MLQRLSIRGKILAVVAVPILVLLLATGVITFGSLQQLDSARNAEELVETLNRARGVQDSLQQERALASNFVHTVQDTESKLKEAYASTDSALGDLATRLAQPDIEDPAAIQTQVDAAINRSGEAYAADARALTLGPATEESNGWIVFPAAEEIAAMQESYAAIGTRLDAIIESLPSDSGLNVPLSALAFRINLENEIATQLFTEPLQYQEPLTSAAKKVDTGIQGLLGTAEELSSSEANDRAVGALLAGREAVADLPDMRADTRAVSTGPTSMATYYSGIIDTIVSAADDVAVAMDDRELVASVQAYGDLDALVENMRYEEVVIERLIRSGEFLPGEAAQVRTMTTKTDLSLADAQDSSRSIGGIDEVPGFGASESESLSDAASFGSVRNQVLTGLDSSLFSARTGDWNQQVAEELAVYEPLREQMWETVESRASSNARGALISTVLTSLAIAAVVIVSIVVALMIARRIIGPLRRLTTTATAVRQELPRLVERVAIPGETVDVSEVQIPVESRDEVGRLAEAFNSVNAATLAIAGEQAALRGSISEMFINVARRDQVLLNRQLASIDEMERAEDDPNTLTKLFALDHLATRMRRNSESLLVLAGIDTGRRLRRAMPLSDVIRTASSEIELYERVQLELDVDPAMLGHSALTTAHLVAELMENATVFSDPGTPVVVRTSASGDDYVIEVIDSGIGMTATELEEANNRVRSTAASEILGAQRLGLFVVGRIARRVGATVSIDSTDGEGTTATVTIPGSVFATQEAEDHAPPATITAPVAMPTPQPMPPVTRDLQDDTPNIPTPPAIATGGYTPIVMAEGPNLSGRGMTEEPAQQPEQEPAVSSLDSLIAADAANAPVAESADLEALTAGSSPAGLPSRRRRTAPNTADAVADQQAIVGLPARATDAQMSALAAEQDSGFAPTVGTNDGDPEASHERASMFRGFRSRRDAEDGAPRDEVPESLGHEWRRQTAGDIRTEHSGGLPARARSTAEPEPISELPPASPGRSAGIAAAGAAGAAAFFARREQELNDDPADSAAWDASGQEASSAPSTPEWAPPVAGTPELADSEPEAPTFRMPSAPSATTPFEAAPAFERAPSVESAPGFESVPMEIPSFEPDEPEFDEPGASDVPVAEATPAAPTYEAPQPAPPQGEQVLPQGEQAPEHFDEFPPMPGALSAPAPTAFEAQPVPTGFEPQPAPSEPTPTDPGSDVPTQPLPAEEPVQEPTSASAVVPTRAASAWPSAPVADQVEPSAQPLSDVDALIQSAADDDTEQRPGFFSRLFGRGRRSEDAQPAAGPGGPVEAAPGAPSAGSATSGSSVFAPVGDAAPAPNTGHAATPGSAPTTFTPLPPAVDSAAAAPAPSVPSAQPEAVPTSFAPEPAPHANSQHFTPVTPQDGEVQDLADVAAPWQQPASTPAQQSFMPGPVAGGANGEPPTVFTPDQLADATGWQAAGASALQAAQPEVATSYQPVIQPDEDGIGDDTDFASAVFSELSSLASERPKVEKTDAGLQRRRPSDADPVTVQPIEPEVDIAPARRDADAVRKRFSSFYSGTQRARNDVATFARRHEPAEANET